MDATTNASATSDGVMRADGMRWTCKQCGTLHGVVQNGKLFIKFKDAQFVVTGTVMACCRRCKTLTERIVVTSNERHGAAAVGC